MSEATTIIFGVLAILLPVMSALIAALYKGIRERNNELKDTVTHLSDQHEREVKIADESHRRIYIEINELRERLHGVDKQNAGWCQKHEDIMAEHTKHIASLDGKLGRYCYTVAEHDARIGNMDHKQSSLKKYTL
jgi:hypothetical protein